MVLNLSAMYKNLYQTIKCMQYFAQTCTYHSVYESLHTIASLLTSNLSILGFSVRHPMIRSGLRGNNF